jgi:hypothetical protein
MLAVAVGGYFAVKHASASNPIICEIYGSYCVAAPSLSYGSPVQNGYGRQLHEDYDSSNGHFKLRFAADTSKCIAADDSNKVIVKGCSDLGTNWTEQSVNHGHILWLNSRSGLYLSGANYPATQYWVGSYQCNGCYQQFYNYYP